MSVPSKSFAEIFNSGIWEGQQKFTDGTIQADDGTSFNIHRLVLSQHSGYFRALFSFKLNQETVCIPSMDSRILESILLYMYTGQITLDGKNVCDLMIASDYLLLDDLLKDCRSFSIQNMTSTSCLPLLCIAKKIDRLSIVEGCYRYALVHFEEIIKTSNSGLEELPFEVLKNLLTSNSLNANSEKSVWEAIVKWTEASSSDRLPHVPMLLTCLRLQEERDEELAAEILSHTIITDNPHCFDLMLSKQFNYYLTKCTVFLRHARFTALCYQNSPYSNSLRVVNPLHIVARYTLTPTKYGSELFLTYDRELDFWRKIGEIDFFADTMVRIGQFIYMYNVWQNRNRVFDIENEEWLPTHDQLLTSYNYHILTLGNQLYSVGGVGEDGSSLNMMFKYNFDVNQWSAIRTPQDVVIYGAATLNDLIYIVGTTHPIALQPNLFLQAYDAEKDFWISLPAPPIEYRRGFSTVAFQEKVFLIAGENNGQCLKNVEVYDPLQNTWMSLPDLPFLYFYPKAMVMDGKLAVCENNNEDMRYYQVAPPVYWDEDTNSWRSIEESSPLYCIERCSYLVLDDLQLVSRITAKNRQPGIEWERIFPV